MPRFADAGAGTFGSDRRPWAVNVCTKTGFEPLGRDGVRVAPARRRNYAGGINFVRPRFYVKFTVTYQGVTRGPYITPSVANGIPNETYTYQGKRLRYGINAQYSLSRQLSVYGSIANAGGFIGGNLRYSPSTPGYMKERRRQEFPSTLQFGIKGQF